MLGAEVCVVVETEMNFLCGVSERIQIVKNVEEGVPWIRRASVLPRHLHVEMCK